MVSSVRRALAPKQVAVFLALALSSIASGSLIFNNSFETPVQSTDGFTYDPGGSGWTFDGNSGIAADGSPWFAGSPPDGTQAAFLQVYTPDGSAAGDSISQTLTGLNVGDTYQFTLYAALRPGFPVDDFDVLLGGTVIADVVATSTSFVQFTTSGIVATSASMPLTFQALNSGDFFESDVAIDLVQGVDVTTSGIPEPSSVVLVGCGIASLTWLRRRKRA
jgi:hypothetical protein